ncbi:hypothetical protein acdb102_15720 [Acidothermaceae bacterium B102]|nr:hypothetical protein acdb102_15720 [Acidothermaceae bacterium B102]
MFNLPRVLPAGAPAGAATRRKRRLTGVFASVLVVGVAAQLHVLTPGGASASAATVAIQPLVAGKTLSGVTSHGGLSAVNSFGSWRGRAADVTVGYLSVGTWASMTGVKQQGLTKIMAGGSAHRVWSVGLLPLDAASEGATLQKAAAGAYNSKFVTIAQGLVDGGDGYSTIRLGWEGNGDWYPWSGAKDPASFAAAYRQEVTAMRSVSGAHFTFDFNMSLGYTNPALLYPGDAYVDIIGFDFYDYNWAVSATSQPTSWNQKLAESNGVNAMASFAAAHGKRLSLPEWGLSYRCDDNHDGGDDTYFIQAVHNWIASHNVAYESYFNADDSSCHKYSMTEGTFPKAASLYKSLWKNGTSSPTPPTTTPPTTTPPTTTPPTSTPPTSKPPTTTPPTSTPPTTTAPSSGSLAVTSVRGSGSNTRSPNWALNGSSLTKTSYIFVNAPSGSSKVRFYLDRATSATPSQTETSAPWDFAGTTGAVANGWNANSVAKGSHTLIVVATLANGSTQSVTVKFNVT